VYENGHNLNQFTVDVSVLRTACSHCHFCHKNILKIRTNWLPSIISNENLDLFPISIVSYLTIMGDVVCLFDH
jgi:hypothetical protein